MAKTVRILHVFISCPKDVEDERKTVEEICGQLTKTLRPSRNIELEFLHWQKDVVPVITGEPTQDEIDRQVNEHDYDIYVGIMWNRYGDKKPNGLSPTEHEFRDALQRKKRTGTPVIQFYFKAEAYRPRNEYEKAQKAEVDRFKQRIIDEDIGLCEPFQDKEDFAKKVKGWLQRIGEDFDFFAGKEIDAPKAQYPPVKEYLQRKVCSAEDYASGRLFYLRDKLAKDSLDTISDCKRIALLGDAGTGKTSELKRIASHFGKEDTPFYPFLFRLNKYVNHSISELLPSEWHKVPEAKRIVILDGLDEIESKNWNDAIRQIELFAATYPGTRIIISCRTNFYERETKRMSGTVSGFSSYVLLDVSEREVNDYIDRSLEHSAEAFRAAIFQNRLHELLKTPFYLIELTELFQKNRALPDNKAEIFEQLLLARMELDINHFRTVKKLRRKQKTVIQTLQRLALGMELLGRNYITDGEYGQLVAEESMRELIEYCTVWKKEESEGTIWKFEHNNFQEYLAAKCLSCMSLATIKEFMFFKPGYKKLIPSWSNTLSFLVSMLKDNDLLGWVVDNEPEVAVAFEPERIEIETRKNIFKRIFNNYKEKQVWINRDKFSYDKLAKFGQSDETVQFLLYEAEKAEHYTTVCNVIELLSYLEIPDSEKERTRDILMKYALSKDSGQYVQSEALIGLADLKLNSYDVVTKIKSCIETRDDEWVRYGLYYFLHESEYLEENIDIFLNGLQYIGYDPSGERSRLIDEQIHLRLGLEKAKSADALEKILKHFREKPQDLDHIILEKSIQIIAENAAGAYSQKPSLFEAGKDLFETLMDKHCQEQASKFVVFFDMTKTRLHVFKEYLVGENGSEKAWPSLALLANTECIKFFVQQYLEKQLNDNDVMIFRNYLSWKNPSLRSTFNDEINAQTGNRFSLPLQKDYEKERKERSQQNINLLFNRQAFLNAIKLIFERENKESLTLREIMDIEHAHGDNPYFSDLAINQLRRLAREQAVTFQDVVDIISRWDWDLFCAEKIHEKFNYNEDVVLTGRQKDWIADWCVSSLEDLDFRAALVTNRSGGSTTSKRAYLTWYFLRKLNLTYPREVLLDLVSYDWFDGGQMVGIEYLEGLLPACDMRKRVLHNLEQGIQSGAVLNNHLDYCKRHTVTDVLRFAVAELQNNNRQDDVRNTALEAICEVSKTAIADLEMVLPKIEDNFKWEVIEKLVENKSELCHKYLICDLKDGDEEERLRAATYLIELKDLKGLKYYVEWIKRHKQAPKKMHHDKSPLISLQVVQAVPYLIDLLGVIYGADYTKNHFDLLENNVRDALAAIAMQSDQNCQTVKQSIEKFITDNLGKRENVNFLHAFIEKLEQMHYARKSQQMSIREVVAKLGQLDHHHSSVVKFLLFLFAKVCQYMRFVSRGPNNPC